MAEILVPCPFYPDKNCTEKCPNFAVNWLWLIANALENDTDVMDMAQHIQNDYGYKISAEYRRKTMKEGGLCDHNPNQ